jgi:hypothetical protein
MRVRIGCQPLKHPIPMDLAIGNRARSGALQSLPWGCSGVLIMRS